MSILAISPVIGLVQRHYSGFQMSTHSFENKKSFPVRVLSFHFAYGKMKTAIVNAIKNFRLTKVPTTSTSLSQP